MRLLGRAVSGVLAVMVLLAPAAPVLAVDDPGPVQWPTIAQPSTAGNASDPGLVKWPTVNPPDSTGAGVDPKPVTWPQVQAD